VKDRHVLGLAGVGVPSEEVVVMLADLTGRVVVADVVEIGLGPGRMDEAEDQQADPQDAGTMMAGPPVRRHAWTSDLDAQCATLTPDYESSARTVKRRGEMSRPRRARGRAVHEIFNRMQNF
jgi:hypothetical protein